MFNELGQVILYIQEYYSLVNERWESKFGNKKVNFRHRTIKHVKDEPEIYKELVMYREFLAVQTFDFDPELTNEDVTITSRTKAYNSMYYKVEKNLRGNLKGNVPISKVLNDLFGIRIIFSEEVTFEKVKEYINDNFPNLKCINSTKNGYNGIHIYFQKDNYSHTWELQVWSKHNQKSNLELHKLYKQDYLKWEKGIEGGV